MKRVLPSLLLLVLIGSLSRCSCTTSTKHPAQPATCRSACDNARKRCGPDELKPAGNGTCEDVCALAARNSLSFAEQCLTGAPTCDAVRACTATH